jgi:glycosyltransferase involved in cell wall biosynthesis
LERRRWKKAPYWLLHERRHLLRAAALHATAAAERAAIERAIPGARVFVAPNGIAAIAPPAVQRRDDRIVFLGRLHPIKGFDVLIPALSVLARERPDVETLFAGPDDCGEWLRAQALASRCDPRPRIRYIGPVTGTAKLELLASARALVLTSHTENFGQVVLEALACGTPAVVGKACPGEQLNETGAGRWVENAPNAIAAALHGILARDADVRSLTSAALRLAARFTWQSTAQLMIAEYHRHVNRP